MDSAKVVSSVLFNYIATITASALGFVVTPVILHHIGARSFGAWALIGSAAGYTSLLDFGVGITVMRLIAGQSHRADTESMQKLASTGLAIYSAVGGVVLIGGIVLAPHLARAFRLAGPGAPNFQLAFIIVMATVALTFPAGLYTGINQGMGRYLEQNLIVVGQAMLSAISGVTVAASGGGLVGLSIAMAATASAGFFAKVAFARRAHGLVPVLHRVDRGVLRLIVSSSVWMFVINISSKLIWDADNMVIGSLLSAVAVAHYAVALGPATAVRKLTEQFNTVSLTAASSLHAQDRKGDLRRLLTEGTRMSVVVICPFLVLVAVWGRSFLALWVGTAYESSAGVLFVLLLGMMAGAVQATATMILLALGKQPLMAKVAIAEAACNLATSVALARWLGILGVALGTTIPTTLSALGFYLPYAARSVGQPLLRVASRLVLPFALSLSAAGLLEWLPRPHFGSLVSLVPPAGALILALFLGSVLIDSQERGTYLRMLNGAYGRIRGSSAQ